MIVMQSNKRLILDKPSMPFLPLAYRKYLAILLLIFFQLNAFQMPALAAGPAPSSSRRVLSLSLLTAVEMALKNNLPLQTVRREINNAASSYRAAKGEYYPKISGNLTSEQTLATFTSGTTLQTSQVYTGGLNLTASMPLDLSGAVGRGVQQAIINFVKAKANYVVSSQTLISNVYQQYYDILRSRSAVKIDQTQLEQTAEQLRIAQERLKTGRVPEVDVLTAKVQYDNAKQTLKVEEGAFEIAKSSLRNTLVIEQDVDIILTDELTFQPESMKFETALKEALENRVEIQIARLNLQSARITLKSTYDPYLPTLNLSTGYGYNIAGRNPLHSWQQRPKDPTYSGGFSINVPIFIFDGGIIRESKVRALTGIDQAAADLKQTKETVSFDVKTNLTQLDNSRERVEIGRASIGLANESLRIAEMRYSLGVTSYLELTDARNNLRTAELNMLEALIGYNNAENSPSTGFWAGL